MERYTCNGAYLEKFSNGAFVKYSDHVAEVGKITDQLESLRTTLCSSLAAHSDHAAELAEWKQRAERAEASLAARIQNNKGSELVLETARDAWRTRAERAEAYVAGQDVRSDFRNAGEMRAALDDLRDTMNILAAETRASRPVIERLERHNTLLRAECEAWRAFRKAQTDGLCSDVGDAIVATFRYAELLEGVDAARAATDAAGILKGAE